MAIVSASMEVFYSAACQAAVAIPNWPVLICVHYYLTIVTLRNEPGGRQLALDHPIASCVVSILVAGSGTIISSLMLGYPILNTVLNERAILCGMMIWFGVHYSPNDIIYSLSSNVYVKLILNVIEELRRSRNILRGVADAAQVYPDSILPLALTGMFKSTGKRWSIKMYQILVGNNSKPYELLSLSFCTKICFIIGLVYAMLFNTVDNGGLVLFGACLLCSLKMYDIIFNKNTDLFQTLQTTIWKYMTIKLTDINEKKQQ